MRVKYGKTTYDELGKYKCMMLAAWDDVGSVVTPQLGDLGIG